MLFTTFLLALSIAVVILLAALLAKHWRRPSRQAIAEGVAPITVALLTFVLIGLGFLVL